MPPVIAERWLHTQCDFKDHTKDEPGQGSILIVVHSTSQPSDKERRGIKDRGCSAPGKY